ncbi:R3H domain-containing nucleic acid-binding protein [Desulforudis sp. DRI-14]
MNPQERRVIHTTLRGRDDIYTFSEGEEPFRKIVIAPRK